MKQETMKAKGDCFEVAAKAMIDARPFAALPIDYKLVHAIVSGQGELEGVRFAHAFNLLGDDTVIDNSNSQAIVLRRRDYFERGGIITKQGMYAEYSREEAMHLLCQHGHWGPWDLAEELQDAVG